MTQIQNVRYLVSLLFLFSTGVIFGQTANITKGCIPLTVDFTANNLSNYYWNFDDGGSSDLQNPSHVFTNPGDYTVDLFDNVGGTKIGSINIKVYSDPVVFFESDKSGGCSPLDIQFSSSISIDNEIGIEGYLWAFGDGSSSTDPNPSYTYTNAGDFAVSLELTTTIPECDQTKIINDFIKVDGVYGNFILEPESACQAPATFQLTSTVANTLSNSYMWDFGNGETSTAYNPGSITYENEGVYEITLAIQSSDGCITNAARTVTVGAPPLALNIPDSVCVLSLFALDNSIPTENFEWVFDEDIQYLDVDTLKVSDSIFLAAPRVRYLTGGWKTINLSAWDTEDCVSDTSFMIYVQDPDPTFTVDPAIDCVNPMTVTLDAVDDSFATYEWWYTPHNEDPVIQEAGSTYTFDFTGPVRDSSYFNLPDTIPLFVEITTALGCVDTISNFFVQRRPEAYFLPSTVRGCAPLTVDFEDESQSHVPVTNWKWLFGTGDEEELTGDGSTSYTYDEPGEYYVKLIIENEVGCIDTSYGVWLYVGEPITSEYTIDKTEVCINETISLSFENMDDRIDAWHFDSDNGRFNDCWTDPDATHLFYTEPGTYPLIVEIEYNGCYSTIVEPDKITVKGARADIGYMINCENPNDVMLASESLNGVELNWTVADQATSTEEEWIHTFPETGDYTIWLEASDPASGCPADVDSVDVFIRNIQAGFTIPEKVCDNTPYTLSAAESVDVDENCYSGYLWILPSNRPREVGTENISDIGFPESGLNEVTLVVTDINGCTDTTSLTTTSYGIEPAFTPNLPAATCLPQEVDFQDASMGDTTLVSWNWSFGANTPNPNYTFTEADLEPIVHSVGDTSFYLPVIYYVQDALGCIDSIGTTLDYYDIFSDIEILPDTILCEGDSLYFSATDFTEQGSFLNYTWDFGAAGIYTEQAQFVAFPEPGTYPLTLTYEEDATGCAKVVDSVEIRVIDIPVADFVTDKDTIPVLCHPTTISFENLSDSVDVFMAWEFSNGAFSGERNPVITFERGTYEATLYVQSLYGCYDNTTRSFTLVGPEGYFTASDSMICVGDEVTFALQDTADIINYYWDFGDGTVVENEDPVTHVYGSTLDDGQTGATLILESTETNCNLDISIPIQIAGGVKVDRMPNVFSPNNDGLNDYFRIPVEDDAEGEIEIKTFKIYNRWGNLVYDNDTPNQGWDGRYKGELAPSEVYAYYIEYTIIGCGDEIREGNVTIIR